MSTFLARARAAGSLSPYGALLVALFVLLLLGFLTSSLASYFASRQAIRQGIIDTELPLTSDNMYSEIQRDMVQPIVISTMMAHDTFLRDWVLSGEKDVNQITHFLQEVKNQYDAVTTYFISDHTGNYYQTNGVLKKMDPKYAHDRWYYEMAQHDAAQSGSPYVVQVDTDEANSGELTIFINSRVFNYGGEFIGVAGVGLKALRIMGVIDGYRRHYGRNVYFVNKDGVIVLAGTEGGPFGARAGTSLAHIPGLKDLISSLPSPQGGNFEYAENRQRHFMNVRFIPELNWYLIVDKSDAGMLAGAGHALYLNLLICALTSMIVLILVTVTLQRYQRQLRMAENKRYDVLSSLTHDMRVPHTSIIALLDIERTAEHSQHILGVYSRIERYTNRALHMADSFVLLARAETQRYMLEEVDLNSVMSDAIEEISPLAQRKRIELAADYPDVDDCVVRVDRDLFRRALINLIENAVKYSGAGTRVECGVFFPEQDSTSICCRIADQGCGMSDAEQTGLFERFRRFKGAEGEYGTGIGLAFVKTVIDRHRGKIALVSAPGKGTRFTITLPRA